MRTWLDKNSLCVGRVACEEKSNTIEAIPRLLDSLALAGATVTIDAAGCQTAIAEHINDDGVTYILVLKGNRGGTDEMVENHFAKSSSTFDAVTEEEGHGRYGKRECWIESGLSFLDKLWKWHGFKR